MKMISGRFNGTGASVYVCCGFIPDFVRCMNMSVATNPVSIEWDTQRGVYAWGRQDKTGTAYIARTYGTATAGASGGIQIYEGGDLLTSTNQTSTTYGEGIYLGRYDLDIARFDNGMITNGSTDATKWTRDSSGIGYFDVGFSSTYFGVGSRLRISRDAGNGPKEYVVTAVADAGAVIGDTSGDVTIDRDAPNNGIVRSVSAKWNFAPLALGGLTPAGFLLNVYGAGEVNVNNDMIQFVAGVYDN